MNFKCLVGLHKWKYTDAVYVNDQARMLASPTTRATRTCKVCGKYQEEDVHCLGLNPPQYTSTWYTIDKDNV